MSNVTWSTRPITLIVTFFYIFTVGSQVGVVRVLTLSHPVSVPGLTNALFSIFSSTMMYIIILRYMRIVRTRSQGDLSVKKSFAEKVVEIEHK